MKYLLITYKTKANGQIDEELSVSKNIRDNDMRICNVILNYADKKVERCFIEGKVLDTDWERLNEYYKQVYPNIIQQLENENVREGN
ncbi:MAG: hypothetical protein ACOVLB_03620 [Candidatus Nanopelagicus sp.]